MKVDYAIIQQWVNAIQLLAMVDMFLCTIPDCQIGGWKISVSLKCGSYSSFQVELLIYWRM